MHVGVNGNPEIDFGRSVLFEMVRMFLEHGHALPECEHRFSMGYAWPAIASRYVSALRTVLSAPSGPAPAQGSRSG